MKKPAVVTFTARGPERLIREQGSQSWRLNPERVRESEYLVCTQNRTQGDWGGASEEHGEAFLIGRISGVVTSDDSPKRWRICISDYGRIKIKDAWKGWRYPVRYTTLEDLGIDLDSVEFHPLPSASDSAQVVDIEEDEFEVRPLTVDEAKAGLAATYKIKPEAIKITIEM
jgi:hypothetical protein